VERCSCDECDKYLRIIQRNSTAPSSDTIVLDCGGDSTSDDTIDTVLDCGGDSTSDDDIVL